MYEKLLEESSEKNLKVYEIPMESYAGRIIDNNIIINRNMTETEKTCTLAEELGHYATSAGDILDYSTVNSKKQERKARLWAADRLISFESIISASKEGIRNLYELAEYLNVTEEFLQDTIQMWKEKYGVYVIYNKILITFDPFGVIEQR